MEIFITNSEKETKDFARFFAKFLKSGDVVAFFGDLGSGKTTFIQGLCEYWNVKEYVNSPTFTLINEYNAENGLKIYHFDCYRISDISEIEELGYKDFVYSDGITLIEWSENILSEIPENAITVKIKFIHENKRDIIIKCDFLDKLNYYFTENFSINK